jgi:hypothetical protein
VGKENWQPPLTLTGVNCPDIAFEMMLNKIARQAHLPDYESPIG